MILDTSGAIDRKVVASEGDERDPSPRTARSGVVAATWNVHGTVGRDGRTDPARIARIVRSLRADVVALQEVPLGSVVSFDRRRPAPAWLERATRMRAIEGPTLRDGQGARGNALLTRLPVISFRLHDLSHRRREVRGAIEATLATRDGPLRFVATHLGLSASERVAQMRRLLTLLDASLDTPTVLIGDFNLWWRRSRAARMIARRCRASRPPATFPSRFPVLALDRIMTCGEVEARSLRAVRTVETALASDHLPLVATIAPTVAQSSSGGPQARRNARNFSGS